MNKRLLPFVVLLTLITGACAGPIAPLDIGSKEVPIDLLLGARKAVAGAPLPPIALPLEVFNLQPYRGGPTPIAIPEPPPGPCPEADPLAVPRLIATNTIDKAPKEGTYMYRTSDKLTTTMGAATSVTTFPLTSTWKVGNILAEPASFTYDIAVTAGTDTRTTTYRVLPMGAYTAPPGAPVGGVPAPPPEAPKPNTGVPPGFYLAGVSSTGLPALKLAFPGIAIVRFPIDRGATFDSSGTDGNTTIKWRSIVGPKITIDACGTPLDTYSVDLTMGMMTTAGSPQVANFTTNYALGTQYGGLPVYVSSTVTGNEGTATSKRESTMTINSEPTAP